MTTNTSKDPNDMIRFTDGASFDVSVELRIVNACDGSYVVGQSLLVPVGSEAEGRDLIRQLSKEPKDAKTLSILASDPVARELFTELRRLLGLEPLIDWDGPDGVIGVVHPEQEEIIGAGFCLSEALTEAIDTVRAWKA